MHKMKISTHPRHSTLFIISIIILFIVPSFVRSGVFENDRQIDITESKHSGMESHTDGKSKLHQTKNGQDKNFDQTNPVHVFLKGKEHHRQNYIHGKVDKTNPVHVFLKGKKHHRHNHIHGKVHKTNPVHVLKGKKHHRHNHIHGKVHKTNPVHVFLKGKKHHRHNHIHGKVHKTNPVHVLKGKKHHRHNYIHGKVHKTNPVHVSLKGKKHHRQNYIHGKVDKTNPVHVFLKGKKHHRHNHIHGKVHKTNPVHVLKGKKHHRHNYIHGKVHKTNPVHVSLKGKKHHRQNYIHGKVDKTNPVHVFLKGKKHHRHNHIHGKVHKTNPVHVFLKGKKHHRHNHIHGKVHKTNPAHVSLKGKKHHRQNYIHGKVEKTNPVHVFLKDKKHHRHNNIHGKVDETNPVHVFLKDKEHEDKTNSQNAYGGNEYFGKKSHTPMQNKIHQQDFYGSNRHTYGYDRAKDMNSAEKVLIPQDTVKVSDLLHISSEVKHLDTAVNRISGFVRKTLIGIRNNMHEMANMVSAVHPIAPTTMSHMIDVTMAKTEKAVQKLCLEPIQKSLKISPWSAWSSWGKCSLTCGSGGYKLRHRQCPSTSHRQCLGNNFDLCHCVLTPCPATWQSWSQWTPCSATCDNGHQMRTRMCLTSSERVQCNGTTSEIKHCFSHKCENSRQKSTLMGHILQLPKSVKKEKFQMKFVMPGSSNTHTSSRYSWSAWTGWTSCKECRKGHRERKRMCVNSLQQPLDDKTLCRGTDVEFGPCVGLVCNLSNAVYVSEGKSMEVKCAVPPHLTPKRVYWITPRNQVITHLSGSKRIRMFGSSLHVAAARYADQGVYRCIIQLQNNTHHIIQETLVVDTCRSHPCQSGGICQTTSDPDFDGIMSYKCRCIGKYSGPFCEIGPLNSNRFVWAIIAIIIVLLVVLAFALFLLRRTMVKAKTGSQNEKQWKKKGKSPTKKKMKSPKTDDKPKPVERSEDDRGDISNTSIVSNDGSFVEITEHDYVDFDGFNLSQEEKNPRGGYESCRASDGYEGKFLKYPSPPYKNWSQNYQQKESDYLTMEDLPKNFNSHQQNLIGFDDEESAYQNISSGEVENFYENLPSGTRGEPIYTSPSNNEQEYIETLKYKGSLKQRRASVDKEALAQKALDRVVENLTRQCLVEIENESRVVATGMNPSHIGSDAPMPTKRKSLGKPVAMDTKMTAMPEAPTESPSTNVENTKSTKRKDKSIKQTTSPQNQETGKLTKSPNAGVSAGQHAVSYNKTLSEVSDHMGNRPDVMTRRVSPSPQGFKQKPVTQTDARSPHVPKDRQPVPIPRRTPEATRQPQTRPPVSPGHRPPVSPGHRPPVTPGHRPPVSPGHRPPVSPGHRPPVSPGLIPPVSPGHRPPVSPAHIPPVSPGHIPPVSPGHRPPVSPAHIPPVSPGHRPRVSPADRQFSFPMKITIRDENQEAALKEHFDTSFVTKQANPNTSTPKRIDKIACMNIIMPSDIMHEDEDDSSRTLGRKTNPSELMVVTSSKVIGKPKEGPVNRGRGNISSNNRQTFASELSSVSEVFSDSYQSLSQAETTDECRGASFRSVDTSTSLQAMPDLDNTVSFPKLTISYQEEGLSQAAGPPSAITEHCYPRRNDSLFQGEITEESLYLSDCNYTQGTPESSELSESDCSSDQTSDDVEEP